MGKARSSIHPLWQGRRWATVQSEGGGGEAAVASETQTEGVAVLDSQARMYDSVVSQFADRQLFMCPRDWCCTF